MLTKILAWIGLVVFGSVGFVAYVIFAAASIVVLFTPNYQPDENLRIWLSSVVVMALSLGLVYVSTKPLTK